ncbi:MAG: glycosyltransferase family 39 protein [Pseudomonadota bacterium]
MQMQRRDLLALGAILLVALALRIPGLNGPLWFDEITTVATHLRLPWLQMMTDYSMNYHYLHDVFAKAFIAVFGEEPWAIRMTALIFGLASIAAAWALARQVAGVPVAHATALLLATNYHQIWFSQNARGYTGLAFFGTVGVILFLRGIAEPRRSTWLWFGATLAASVFTHLTGAFLYAALGLVWLALALGKGGRELWVNPLLGFLAGGVATLLLYLPVMPSLIETVGAVSATSAVDPMQEYQSPLWAAAEAFRTALGEGNPLIPVAGLLVVALAFTGAVALRRAAPLFPVIVAVHIALTVTALMALGMRIWPRFFFVDIAFLMILLVEGVRFLCDRLARAAAGRLGGRVTARSLFLPAAAGMVLLSLPLAARNYRAPKQDLEGAYRFVEAARRPDERVFAVGQAASAFTGFYGADWAVLMDGTGYRAAMARPGPVTFVVAFPGRVFRIIPQMARDRGTVLTEVKWFPGTLGDGGVAVLRRD